jgi:Lrp/AsnC family leucine-responsive transcriptional regulator
MEKFIYKSKYKDIMDNIDKKILYELNWDCRQTNSEIGKKLRVSKQVVNYRISKLEKDKIIKGYSALIDWRRLGYNAIRIYLKWGGISIEKEQEIYEFMRKDPFFMWVVKFEGDFDIGFYVWVKSIPGFANKWKKFLTKYKQYILKQEIYESVTMEHYPMKILFSKDNFNEKIIGLNEKIDFDVIDYEILKIISDNARMPIIEISEKIKLTPKAIMYRIKNLEKKGIILGYNAIIDSNKLGYTFYKVDFYLKDLSKIDEMFLFSKFHKNIVYLVKTIGGPDYEIEVMVKDVFELNSLINEIRKKFQNQIEHYRFHRFEQTIKQVYLPGK